MRIRKVEIQNWRSIKDIEFYPSNLNLLIGANNAGKTNIMSAINFVLGDRWPMPGNLDDGDFYNRDRSRKIKITIEFENCDFRRIDFDTARENFTLQIYDKNGQLMRSANNETRLKIYFAYVDANRSFEKQFSHSRYSMFGQSLRTLHSELQKDPTKIAALTKAMADAQDQLKTDMFTEFEATLKQKFSDQLSASGYDVKFDFKMLDDTNFYRGIYPTIQDGKDLKSPNEVGSGVRNLLVLALFQTYAKIFKGGSILAMEEPELFLHPHAQRSLAKQFRQLAAEGSQIFISSHSPIFMDVANSQQIVVVDKCHDAEAENCSQVRSIRSDTLLKLRKALHPEKSDTMNEASVSAFLENIKTTEMAEPFFSKFVFIVEGPSERDALTLYFEHLGYPIDENGISIVSAGGKTIIDPLFNVYEAHQIPRYVVFDNDRPKKADDRKHNKVMCRMLKITETDLPDAVVTEEYAIMEIDWEKQVKADIDKQAPGLYDQLETEAKTEYAIEGKPSKPLISRYITRKLIERGIVPETIRAIYDASVKRITAIKNEQAGIDEMVEQDTTGQ